MHTVRFVHTGGTVEAQAEEGQTLLNVADQNGVPLYRGCNHGACGICRLQVLHGLENLLNKRRKQPFETERVESCIALVRGDVEVMIGEKQLAKPAEKAD